MPFISEQKPETEKHGNKGTWIEFKEETMFWPSIFVLDCEVFTQYKPLFETVHHFSAKIALHEAGRKNWMGFFSKNRPV